MFLVLAPDPAPAYRVTRAASTTAIRPVTKTRSKVPASRSVDRPDATSRRSPMRPRRLTPRTARHDTADRAAKLLSGLVVLVFPRFLAYRASRCGHVAAGAFHRVARRERERHQRHQNEQCFLPHDHSFR